MGVVKKKYVAMAIPNFPPPPPGTIMQLSVCQVIPVGELLAVMPP